MANGNGHGGYRAPARPAAVSGPGAFSARTDGGPAQMDLSNAKYGENADFQAIQGGASMSPPAPSAGAAGAPAPVSSPTPLSDPTSMPGVPVTAGANAGAGPDSGALGLPQPSGFSEDVRARYGQLVPWLIRKADSPYASQELRDQVRFLLANL